MDDPVLVVTVPGRPRGQGSMTLRTSKNGKEQAFYATETVDHRNLAVTLLREAWGNRAALAGPVAVRITARFARPRSHWLPANSKRPERVLRDPAPIWWEGFPDQDKISRLMNDALTIAGVIVDDRLVVACRVQKIFADTSGTDLKIWEL